MLKSGKQLVKLGIGPYELLLVLKIVKVPDNYYSTAISCRILLEKIILYLNLLHSLRTCSYNNVLKIFFLLLNMTLFIIIGQKTMMFPFVRTVIRLS